MRSKALSGVFAPITTPFNAEEKIEYGHLAENIAFYNTTELRGYMPLGSNGEFLGLTDEEAIRVLKTVVNAALREKCIVGGCGRESAHHTVEFIKKAADIGLDYAFVLPPHYFLPFMNDEALLRYYEHVAGASPVPVVIYNAPKFAAGLTISPSLIERLAGHENIAALKNSSAVPNAEYIAAAGQTDFAVIAGNIASFFDGLTAGASGAVLSTATFLPEACCLAYALYRAGRKQEASGLHARLNALSAKSVGKYGVAGVKCGLDLRGLKGGHVRMPLMDLSGAQRRQIASVFSEYGIEPIK